MTTTKTLNATKRDESGKGHSRKLRQAGRIPAVLYGKDMETVSLTLDAMEAGHLFAGISVENTIIDLQVEGDAEPHQALIREIQAHPHKKELVHVDFYRIQKGVAVDVEVPVELVGTPVGVKQHGGVLEHLVHELPVRCLPSLIPDVIEVDVSALEIDDSIHLSELKLPEGVEVDIDDDRTICLVSPPRLIAEDEEEDEEAGEAAEPEVIGHESDEDDED